MMLLTNAQSWCRNNTITQTLTLYLSRPHYSCNTDMHNWAGIGNQRTRNYNSLPVLPYGYVFIYPASMCNKIYYSGSQIWVYHDGWEASDSDCWELFTVSTVTCYRVLLKLRNTYMSLLACPVDVEHVASATMVGTINTSNYNSPQVDSM